MAKVEAFKIPTKELEKNRKELMHMLRTLMARGQFEEFLKGFFTESEHVMFSRRLQIVKLLLSGASYRQITKELRVGLITIRSVDRWLQEFREYRTVFKGLSTKGGGLKRPLNDPVPTFGDLRRKYPLHFLLFNLLLDE